MIVNGSFEDGLKGWRIVSGSAFTGQPVAATTVMAQDVLIDGSQPVISLGGDYWHIPYEIGQEGDHLVRAIGPGPGVLESDPFLIDGRFLAFRIGGSAEAGAIVELRVAAKWLDQNPVFRALDRPDAGGFVAVRRAKPTGSDRLRDVVWRLEGKRGLTLVGAKGKIRLSVDERGTHRLAADDFRLLPDQPPPHHPKLWGWADIHCHPMAQAGFGGLMAGHMHGPVEDLGSCVLQHGVNHASPLHPIPALSETGHRTNDGSVATPGWAIGTPAAGEELEFRGWPDFDDLTHIKVHQDWIRRAWEGGQRLMCALIVHSELLAKLMNSPQTDRDTVEPQIRMLREFVAHNRAWCGLARTPADARLLIEANKLAFVLGIETDSINGWIDATEFSSDRSQANLDAIHAVLHPYFKYLRDLGVVQMNLLHLSDSAFGGMALYDFMFMVNSWFRTGQMPSTIDGYDLRPEEDQISRKVSTKSTVWAHLDSLAQSLGFPAPSPLAGPWVPNGDRNANGLTVAGEVAVLEAMRFGLVIDLDHMSELSAETAHTIATTTPAGDVYPLVSAHNGARRMAPRAWDPAQPIPTFLPGTTTPVPNSEFRRSTHAHPNENAKSNTQLDWIRDTGGMFGHGTAGADSRTWGAVANDCPGSDKTFAQGYQYVLSVLKRPVALGTDWNSLLEGAGPRFGPRAAHGLVGEVEASAPAHQSTVRIERRGDVKAQSAGVLYDSETTTWRHHRFEDSGLYAGTFVQDEGSDLWQATAIIRIGVDTATVEAGETLPEAVSQVIRGFRGEASTAMTQSGVDCYRAGQLRDDATAVGPTLTGEGNHVEALVLTLREIDALWTAMLNPGGPAPTAPAVLGPPQSMLLTRSTAGKRDFDYNLDGLAHYGMLPDMFQDLKNVGFPIDALQSLFGSAEQYVKTWEQSDTVGRGLADPLPR
jgi:hypothetical protein